MGHMTTGAGTCIILVAAKVRPIKSQYGSVVLRGDKFRTTRGCGQRQAENLQADIFTGDDRIDWRERRTRTWS